MILIFALLLFSCKKSEPINPFEKFDVLSGVFVCGTDEYFVTVKKNADSSVTVVPEDYNGYAVTFFDDSTQISLDGITFDIAGDFASRFYPVKSMVCGDDIKITENEIVHSSGCVFRGFR